MSPLFQTLNWFEVKSHEFTRTIRDAGFEMDFVMALTK